MTRLRDDTADFAAAIGRAADELGLSPLFVEKDYWVTEVLRALHLSHPGAFVFKGGTSLSKGYGIIERFSEDVDILVQPSRGDTARRRESLLAQMVRDVASQLAVPHVEARAPGRGRSPHRADVLVYPRVTSASIAAPTEDRGVLLETGYAGRDWPSEMVELRPILCDPLGIEPGAYDDTCLLRHAPTRRALEDRVQFELMLRDVHAVSAAHFGGTAPRPDGGYADSPAFAPPHESELRRWLQRRYETSAELLPARASGGWPAFGDVLRRVAVDRRLL